jgi:hypothetical protein
MEDQQLSNDDDHGLRRSSRVRKSAERYIDLYEPKRRRSLRNHSIEFTSYIDKFFHDLSKQYPETPKDFYLPKEWAQEELQIPPYRHLKQNLYRPPLTRPIYKEEDCLICNCKARSGVCDNQCMNRAMFM